MSKLPVIFQENAVVPKKGSSKFSNIPWTPIGPSYFICFIKILFQISYGKYFHFTFFCLHFFHLIRRNFLLVFVSIITRKIILSGQTARISSIQLSSSNVEATFCVSQLNDEYPLKFKCTSIQKASKKSKTERQNASEMSEYIAIMIKKYLCSA